MLAKNNPILHTANMTNPEFSDYSSDDIDKEYQSLVERSVFINDESYSIEPLEAERQMILDSLVDHMMTIDGIHTVNADDSETISGVVDTLTGMIEKDFENMQGLTYGDEIIASGPAIAIRIERTEEGDECNIQTLTDGSTIKGTIEQIVIQEIPAVTELYPIIYDREYEPGQIDSNLFGVSLRIIGAIIENENGGQMIVPSDTIVTIPLNYPSLKLQRVIRQESI